MKRPLIPLLFAGLAVGCSGDAPTSTELLAPNFRVAGNSGCYTVTINSHASGLFPSFAGSTTGDVEANISTMFDAGESVAHGVVRGNEGLTTWNVTGGNIPELIDQSFTVSQRSLTILQPDNDPLLVGVDGTARAAGGVSKANLTNHGTFDARDLTPPFEVDLVWRGVICP